MATTRIYDINEVKTILRKKYKETISISRSKNAMYTIEVTLDSKPIKISYVNYADCLLASTTLGPIKSFRFFNGSNIFAPIKIIYYMIIYIFIIFYNCIVITPYLVYTDLLIIYHTANSLFRSGERLCRKKAQISITLPDRIPQNLMPVATRENFHSQLLKPKAHGLRT